MESKEKNLKYPSNLRVKALLERGDAIKIASEIGYHADHIRRVLNGHEKMTEKIEKAISKILKRRISQRESFHAIVKEYNCNKPKR